MRKLTVTLFPPLRELLHSGKMPLSAMVFLLFLLPALLPAQTYPWEIGGGVYVTSYQGDLHTPELNFGRYSPRPALGIHLRRNVSNSFIIRLNALFGQLAGDDNSFDEPAWHKIRGISFSSPIAEFTALGELYPFGMFRYFKDGERRRIAPFLTLGVGTSYTNPKVDWNDENGNSEIDPVAAQFDRSRKLNRFNIAIPVGLGLRFALSTRATIGLEAAIRPTFSDYIDGVSRVGNPEKTDWYFAGGLTYSYAFGKRQTPVIATTEKPKPDRDRDGVPDKEDLCPDLAGVAKQNGCPDTDDDGVIDLRDKCPDQAGSADTDGCPDSDRDGVTDREDACPNVAGDAASRGCPDTDRDGVPDKDDDCPLEKGLTAARGCPDADLDGVADKNDACPDKKGTAAGKGCPDTDKDGVFDNDDRCPEVAGVASARGCPEIKAEDKEKLKRAVKLVQFETGSDRLLRSSYPTLDEVAELMFKYPGYSLSIGGHTDNAGNAEANQSLSERRAYACYLYLMRKDVALSRMTYAGFGETRPVADNATQIGRAQNRRVEFELYVK